MINLTNLTFQYHKGNQSTPTIGIPELHIRKDRKTMLSGKSGCGKTTLLNLITGILPPDSGTIMIGDRDISAMGDRARRLYRLNHIGYVLQDFSLIPHLRIQDNIKVPFYINPGFKFKPQHRDRMNDLLKRLDIEPLRKKYPPQLSVGEKQRACLCRALATGPQLILADEPTANLDEENRDEVLRVLDEYIQSERATLVMVCHDTSIRDWFDDSITFQDINRV